MNVDMSYPENTLVLNKTGLISLSKLWEQDVILFLDENAPPVHFAVNFAIQVCSLEKSHICHYFLQFN